MQVRIGSFSMSNENKLSIDQVMQIAKLARLEISMSEAERFSQQLSHVLGHFEQISKIDTTGIEPLVTPSDINLVLREDVVIQNISSEALTANAPAKSGNLFKVPPVIG